MGYPTKVQLISRKKGNQWYVNFPNALAEAMGFRKGETVEWEIESLSSLHMVRKKVPARKRLGKKRKERST